VKKVLVTVVLSALLLAPVATAGANPPQRASLSNLENEVMCLVCGTTLAVSDSPQADRERAFIRALIAQGETESQIKKALVAQYGQRVLATPSDSGFDLAAWIVPGLAVILAAIGIAFAVVRWRRGRPAGQTRPLPTTASAAGPPTANGDGARLTSDLERYDL
jgi:cytochrome c-type biogenesis protein CcmH/NrfF